MRNNRVFSTRTGWSVFCPGCNKHHYYDQRWTFNGNMTDPTFTPSYKSETADASGPIVCHSQLTDGVFTYYDDSTHHLKGKTAEVGDLDAK